MKKFSLILIIIGIFLIAIPPVGQFITAYNEKRMINEWTYSEDTTVQDATKDTNPEDGYKPVQEAFETEKKIQIGKESSSAEKSSITTSALKVASKPTKKKSSKVMLGIIKISKIKVNLPVVEGANSDSLRYGAGHIPGTSGIGQPGNCVLAGHRNYTFGRYFNRLDELVEGDEILVSTKKINYKYKVYQKLVVTPEDVSVLTGNNDDNILTLITCTPIYIASHRLVIKARLVGQEDR